MCPATLGALVTFICVSGSLGISRAMCLLCGGEFFRPSSGIVNEITLALRASYRKLTFVCGDAALAGAVGAGDRESKICIRCLRDLESAIAEMAGDNIADMDCRDSFIAHNTQLGRARGAFNDATFALVV